MGRDTGSGIDSKTLGLENRLVIMPRLPPPHSFFNFGSLFLLRFSRSPLIPCFLTKIPTILYTTNTRTKKNTSDYSHKKGLHYVMLRYDRHFSEYNICNNNPPPPQKNETNLFQGDDVCAVENELSLEARQRANARRRDMIPPTATTTTATTAGNKTNRELNQDEQEESFDVPVVLMTLGWDPAGDPTHNERGLGRDHACVFRVLEMPRVVRWFTSHTRYDSHTDEKVR